MPARYVLVKLMGFSIKIVTIKGSEITLEVHCLIFIGNKIFKCLLLQARFTDTINIIKDRIEARTDFGRVRNLVFRGKVS